MVTTVSLAAAPDRPWEPERTRSCLLGRVMVKVVSGEARDHVPHYLDVARGLRHASMSVDDGAVDRVLRKFSPAMQVTRAFHAARQVTIGGETRHQWDDLEERLGLSRTYRIDLDPETSLLALLEDLKSLSIVESATPLYLAVTPFARSAGLPPLDRFYAQRMVGVDEALAFEPGDSALIVGIVDSGVALDHHEFTGKLRPGVDTVDLPPDRTARGLNVIGDTTDPDRIPRDEMGHGTACASIIGARGHRVPRGLAGEAHMLAARALAAARFAERSTLTALGSIPDIDQAVKLAVDLGAKVLNLSFGTPETALRPEDPRPHEDVIAYAVAKGAIPVAASGNSGTPTRYFPAAHPGVLAVGSVDEHGLPSSFSTRGDHVALCAPGEHVFAAGLEGYQAQSGTSFAAPFVAGACALLVARAARYGVPFSADDARAYLTRHARPFAPSARVTGCGAGVLDLPAALRALEGALGRRDRRAAFSADEPPSAAQSFLRAPPSRGPTTATARSTFLEPKTEDPRT
jgi:subtilisin family serine protease